MTAVTAVTLPEQTVGAIMSTADAVEVTEVAETADVVAGVRDRVELLDAPALIPEIPGAAAATDPRFVQLWPHRHGTDAMFLALMRKR